MLCREPTSAIAVPQAERFEQGGGNGGVAPHAWHALGHAACNRTEGDERQPRLRVVDGATVHLVMRVRQPIVVSHSESANIWGTVCGPDYYGLWCGL